MGLKTKIGVVVGLAVVAGVWFHSRPSQEEQLSKVIETSPGVASGLARPMVHPFTAPAPKASVKGFVKFSQKNAAAGHGNNGSGLRDPDFKKRLFAIRALGKNTSDQNKKLLEENLKRKDISDVERVATRGTLFKISNDQAKKKTILNEISETAEKSVSAPVGAYAFQELLLIAPGHPRTAEVAEAMLRKTPRSPAAESASTYLENLKRENLQRRPKQK